jgi:hypothetical protein
MRLNGWQRIGVVASVCWFLGGGLWIGGIVIDDLSSTVRAEYRRCLDAHSIQPDGTVPKDTDWGPCMRTFEKDFDAAVANHWYYTAAYTLIPIPIVWLIVYGLVAWCAGSERDLRSSRERRRSPGRSRRAVAPPIEFSGRLLLG